MLDSHEILSGIQIMSMSFLAIILCIGLSHVTHARHTTRFPTRGSPFNTPLLDASANSSHNT